MELTHFAYFHFASVYGTCRMTNHEAILLYSLVFCGCIVLRCVAWQRIPFHRIALYIFADNIHSQDNIVNLSTSKS